MKIGYTGHTLVPVLLGLSLLLPAVHVQAQPSARRDKQRTITVTGTATVKAAPDRVRIGFEVETRAATAEKAAAENARQSDAVLRALKAIVEPPGKITTSGYQLTPEYSYGDRNGARRRTLDGYVAANRLRVVSSDLAGAGALIDKAVAAGATRAGSVSFFREDLTAAKHQALLEAGRSARGEAEAIAESLGVSLGAVLTASSSSSSPFLPQSRAMAMRDAVVSTAKTPIEAGEIAVSVTVNVLFEIR